MRAGGGGGSSDGNNLGEPETLVFDVGVSGNNGQLDNGGPRPKEVAEGGRVKDVCICSGGEGPSSLDLGISS